MLGTLDICLQWVIQVILKGRLVRTSTWLISSSTTARYIISNWKMGEGDHPWLYQWKRVHDPYFSTKTRSLISRDNDALIYLPACCLVHSGGAHSGAAARRDTVQYGVMHSAGHIKKVEKKYVPDSRNRWKSVLYIFDHSFTWQSIKYMNLEPSSWGKFIFKPSYNLANVV